MIWIGRSAGDSRCSTIGRPPASRVDASCRTGPAPARCAAGCVAGVVDRRRSRPVGSSSDGGRQRVELGSLRPRQLRPQHRARGRSARGRRGRSRPARYGASHSSSVRVRCSALQSGHGSPTVRCRKSTRCAQRERRRDQPSTARPVARTRAEQRSGRVAAPALARAHRLAEAHRTEPALDALDEVVAVRGPTRARRVSVDLVVELGGDLVGVERRRRGGSAPGRGGRRGRRRRRTPRGRAGRVSGSQAPVPERSWNWPGRRRRGEPVGIGVEQHGTGAVGVDRSRVEPRCRAGGRGRRRGRGHARRRAGRRDRGGLDRRAARAAARGRLGSSSGARAARRARRAALPPRSRARSARRPASPPGGDARGSAQHPATRRGDGARRRRARRARSSSSRPARSAFGRRRRSGTPGRPPSVPHAASSSASPARSTSLDLGRPVGLPRAVLDLAPQPVARRPARGGRPVRRAARPTPGWW